MSLLQRIIEHFQNLVLVSDITMTLIGVSIIIMSGGYFYCTITKKNQYENIIVKIGVIIRILMLIGFTIEFSHQKFIYKGISLPLDKYGAMEQFSNYLFYGYLFVIGIYDIYTVSINKFRGFFHAFDLTMMSIPLLYWLTELVIKFNFEKDTFIGLLIMVYLLIFPYLFFKLYWKQNKKWYSIYFIYSLFILVYTVIKVKEEGSFTSGIGFMTVPVSYFLLGMYELSRHFFNKIKNVISSSAWNKLKIGAIIIPFVLIYSCIIALNFSPLQINKTYTVNSVYRKNATFTSRQEAEQLVRTAVDDTTSKITLWEGITENFNNRYEFYIGDYSVEIDGATGKITNIITNNENQNDYDDILNEGDVKEKTIKWLKNIGFIYDEKYLDMKVEKENNRYSAKLFNKYTDGSIHDYSCADVEWNINGKIYSAGLGSGLLNIKDYKEIKIDENVISENINTWYKKLGEETPAYMLGNFAYWFGETDPLIDIACKNHDAIRINAENGQIVSFNNGKVYDKSMTDEEYYKLKTNAEEKARTFSANYDNYNFIDSKQDLTQMGTYFFKAANSSLEIKLDKQGNMTSFKEDYSCSKEYNDKDFKVSSSTALKLVSNKYGPLGIYAKRAKLAIEINEDGTANYKWMVVVIPLKNVEHQIYYVDTDTGEITPLVNYS